MVNSDIFLLIEDISENGNENITGKIFEYLSYNKPILAYCNKKSNISEILELTGSGNIINDKKDLELFFKSTFYFNFQNIKKFTRSYQFEKLLSLLKKIKKWKKYL